MKSLTDKISGHAPTANTQIGADFQAYLLRERESYLKSVHEFEKETPMIQSLSKLRDLGAASRPGGDDDQHSPGVAGQGSYQQMSYQQTPGVNSLHYMS